MESKDQNIEDHNGFTPGFQSGLPVLDDHICGLYCIAPRADGPTKIGVTNNMQRRVAGMQTGYWAPLRVYGFRLVLPQGQSNKYKSLQAAFKAGAFALEKRVQVEMRKHDLALLGEWYDLTSSEAFQVIDKCSEMYDLKSVSISRLAGSETMFPADEKTQAVQKRLLKSLAQVSVYVNAHNERADRLDA